MTHGVGQRHEATLREAARHPVSSRRGWEACAVACRFGAVPVPVSEPGDHRPVRESVAPVDVLAWTVSLVLVGFGVASGNPAALLLGQIGWFALLLMPQSEMWHRIPVAAVLVLFVYVAAGEVAWLAVRMTGLTNGWQLTAALPSMLSGVLGTASAGLLLSRLRERGTLRPPVRPMRQHFASAAGFVALLAVAFPALRSGTQLGAAGFAIPGTEHMHNLLRAAVVNREGLIPYGILSPVRNFTGDYYPRGFHLVSAWLNAGVDVRLDTEPQPWVLGYLRLFWLLWAITVMSFATAAGHAFRRLGHQRTVVAACLGASIIFLPSFYDGVVLVGFSSYLLAITAVSVSIMTFLFQPWNRATVLVSLAAFVVASHGWLVLAVVPFVLAVRQLWSLRPRPQAAARPSAMAWTAGLAVSAALAVMAARPWVYTLLSGDASRQARENGYIEAPPPLAAVVAASGLTLILFWPAGRSLARRAAVPVGAMACVVVLGFRAAGWDLELYYPRKLVWATTLLLLPLALAAWLHLGDRLLVRVSRDGSPNAPRAIAGLVVLALVTFLVRASVPDLLLNRPRMPADSVRLAERAVESGGQYQLIAVGVGDSDADRASSMWGRAARDMRGLPSLDVSEIDFDGATAAGMCYHATAAGVPAHVITRLQGSLTERTCPA